MPSDRQNRIAAYAAKLSKVARGEAEGVIDLEPSADPIADLIDKRATSDDERNQLLDIHKKVLAEQQLAVAELGLYEAIILPEGRPAWFIQNGKIVGEIAAPWGDFGRSPIRDTLERALQSIGRVELQGPTRAPYAGTAFVVGPRLLMTNRHVAKLFSRGAGERVAMIAGFTVGISFLSEPSGMQARVSRVVMMHPYWDMALLEVDGQLPAPLTLAPTDGAQSVTRRIAVIGYPAFDPRNPPDVQARVFNDTYGVKRLQPGQILGVRPYLGDGRVVQALAHDASTLGGNSGSAVLDPLTGNVVGLHFGGEYSVANYAVPAAELARDQRVRKAGVQFTTHGDGTPSPWDAEWSAVDETVATAPPPRFARSTSDRSVITVPIEIEIAIKATT
jgi:V8-like Glu-specific endopeptidase